MIVLSVVIWEKNLNCQVEANDIGLIDENILIEPPEQDEESVHEEPGNPEND